MKRFVITLALIVGVAGISAAADEYEFDVDHSHVGFKVAHMVISKVPGEFTRFDGKLMYADGKPAESSVEVEIDIASIDTRNEKRDEHLRSGDFFDAEKFPKMTFKSTKIEGTPESFKIHGDLTLRGVTKPVVLEASEIGKITDPWGNERVGFNARTSVNRQDFGVSWSKSLDSGGLVVSDQVQIEIEIEAIKKK